ncbi:transmembrane amino acid transporter family protein [Actinidia rufa]|uniref:Transmembrane amino acid transporter family protein n=1 Tax=Actinidia rufa TaxID=165716 RepID=A0A7J0GF81_9ERIC|nr:transmembrane amino acid transporter family protein [Actinidia rufa]
MGFDKEASSSSHSPSPPLPREDTPLLTKSPPLSSNSKTFANIFIAVVGAGVLGLPYTFKRTGWAMGSLMLFAVAFLTYYCMMLLVHTRAPPRDPPRIHQDRLLRRPRLRCLRARRPLRRRRHDRPLPGRLLRQLPHLHRQHIVIHHHHIFADVVDLGAMGVVMVEDVMIFLQQRPVLQAFGGFSVFFYGLGVAVYAFEGIGMVLPLESETKKTSKSLERFWVLSMTFISLMFGAFGALGYFAFVYEVVERRFCEASSVCIVLGFVLPALFHLIVHKQGLGLGGMASDVALVVLGLVLAVCGTWSSLLEIFGTKS